MAKVPLRGHCQARSGDKGNIADLTVFAPDEPFYRALCDQLTAEALGAFFGDWVKGPILRWELPEVRGLHFVLHGALGGGAAGLRMDQLGKSLGSAVLRFEIDL